MADDIYRQQIAKKAPGAPEQHAVIIKPNQANQAMTQAIAQVSDVLGKVSATYINAVNYDQTKTAQVYVANQIQQYLLNQQQKKTAAYENDLINGEQGALSIDSGLSPTDRMVSEQEDFQKFQDKIRKEVMEDMRYAGGKRDLGLWLDETFNNVGNKMTEDSIKESIGIMNARSMQRANDLINKGEFQAAREERITAESTGIATTPQVIEDLQLINEREAFELTKREAFKIFDETIAEKGTDLLSLISAKEAGLKAIKDSKRRYLTDAMKANLEAEMSRHYSTQSSLASEKRAYISSELKESYMKSLYKNIEDGDIEANGMRNIIINSTEKLTTSDFIYLNNFMNSWKTNEEPLPVQVSSADYVLLAGEMDADVKREMWAKRSKDYSPEVQNRGYEIIDNVKGKTKSVTDTIALVYKELERLAFGDVKEGEETEVQRYWRSLIPVVQRELHDLSLIPDISKDEIINVLWSYINDQPPVVIPSPGEVARGDKATGSIWPSKKIGKLVKEIETNGMLLWQEGSPEATQVYTELKNAFRLQVLRNWNKEPIDIYPYPGNGIPVFVIEIDGEERHIMPRSLPNDTWRFEESKDGKFEEFQVLTEAQLLANQADYDYWEGQKKGLFNHPEIEKAFTDEDKQMLHQFLKRERPFKNNSQNILDWIKGHVAWDLNEATNFVKSYGALKAEQFLRESKLNFNNQIAITDMKTTLRNMLEIYFFTPDQAKQKATEIINGFAPW